MTRIAMLGLILSASASFAEEGKANLPKLFNDVAAKVGESTVRVRCDGKDAALGTVIDAKGYILTKGSELKGSISVRLRDGSEYDAQYIGYHEKTDLAMLKIDASDLVAVSFEPAKVAEAGNMVAAAGIESEPVAAGIVSAGVRKLVGEEGEIKNGNKGMLGIQVDIGRTKEGVFVDEFNESQGSSPAKRAGIKPKDQIIQVQEAKINSFDDLKAMLNKFKPGDKVTVLVRRKVKDSDDTEELSFDVKLGSGALFDRSEMQNRMGSQLSGRRTGFPQVITTDLIIKPTDCGGPIVDLEGRALGVVIARAGRVESWVLPKEIITPLVPELKSGKLKPKDVK